jgi:hypothetical protein
MRHRSVSLTKVASVRASPGTPVSTSTEDVTLPKSSWVMTRRDWRSGASPRNGSPPKITDTGTPFSS